MTKVKKVNKRKLRTFILAILSLVVIFGVTFSIGRYWIEIFDKYKGYWEVEPIEGSEQAYYFWEKTIEEYTENNYEIKDNQVFVFEK